MDADKYDDDGVHNEEIDDHNNHDDDPDLDDVWKKLRTGNHLQDYSYY